MSKRESRGNSKRDEKLPGLEDFIHTSFDEVFREGGTKTIMRRHIGRTGTTNTRVAWEDFDWVISGKGNVVDHFVQCRESIPNLKLEMRGMERDAPDAVRLDFVMSGTQTKPFLPFFPVGRNVQWSGQARVIFDACGMVRKNSIRLRLEAKLSLEPCLRDSLSECARALAATAQGSRLLQQAVDLASAEDHGPLVEQLRGYAWEAAASPHANHILQKFIVAMAPWRVQFVVDEFRGRAVEAAKHPIRSRIVERLLEHLPEPAVASLEEELIEHTLELCRHPFGNFPLQRALEHCGAERRSRFVQAIRLEAPELARHRIASNVVRCALVHSAPEDRRAIAGAMADDVDDLKRHPTASFVMRELNRLKRIGAL